MPYFLLIDYDVDRFKEIIELAKSAKTEDEFNKYLKEMEPVKQYAINNGEIKEM